MRSRVVTETVQPLSLPVDKSPAKLPTGLEHDQFCWAYTEEPHRTRRQAIIKAHPEVSNPLILRKDRELIILRSPNSADQSP